jgi:isopenicillin N synthase-like dioxygenase
MLEVWSNKRYKAALHRVLPSRGGNVRYSVPFFYSPSPTATVTPILLSSDEKPQYQSINYGTYRELLYRSFNEDIPLDKQARLPNYRIFY